MKNRSIQAELLNNVIGMLINQGKRLDAIENDLNDLEIKVNELKGEDIPHGDTWYTIQDYCEYYGLNVDSRMLHDFERKARKISEMFGCDVIETRQAGCHSRFAFHESVLDEVFGIRDDYEDEDDFDDCEYDEYDEDDEDDEDEECEDCPCFGCPHCPAEEDD